MKCFYHNDRDAVAQCTECGKFLCSECAEVWEPPHCPSCGKAKSSYNKSSAAASLIVTGIFFALGAVLAGFSYIGYDYSLGLKLFGILLFGYIFASLPAGWRKLSNLTSKFFLALPIIGWLFYFAIKAFLSFFVGCVVMPIETAKDIRALKRG